MQGVEALRAAAYLDVLTKRLDLPAAYGVTIHEAIPDHVGLGSGTQLALALASALRAILRACRPTCRATRWRFTAASDPASASACSNAAASSSTAGGRPRP